MLAVEFQNVSKRFGQIQAVNGLSFTLERGKALCLFGPSGCGKTTVLRLVAGLEKADTGTVRVMDRCPEAFRAWGRMGMVFQDLALWPHMRAERQVAFMLYRVSRRERRRRARETLGLCRLADRARAYPAELSGGQQQRLAIARAIVAEPEILLLDEPFANLDGELRAHFMDLFRRRRDAGCAIIFATHLQEEMDGLADETLNMDSAPYDIAAAAKSR